MTANKRIFLNVIATYGRSLFNIACGLFSVRWVLSALGHDNYGLFNVIGGLTVFIGFINVQLSSAIGRYFAVAIGEYNVCTAGPLMKLERDEVASYFCAPVYMEYGAMDAGCMAYMQKDGRYHVFQHYRMLHTINDGTGDLNLVTTLAKDYLPFFRYQVGDYLKDCTYTPDGRVLTIGEVYGRGSDVITLPSGNKCQCYTFMVCAEEKKGARIPACETRQQL